MKKYIEDVRDEMVCLMLEMEYDDSDIQEVFNITQEQINLAEQNNKDVFYPTWIKNTFFKENRNRKNNLHKRNIVYFIKQDIPNGMIKIGYTSRNVSNRLSSLQTGSPYNLIVLKTIDGDMNTEFELHKKFSKYRLSGEWFDCSPEIISYIENT